MTGKRAAEPVTAVQGCVLKFLRLKPVDVVKETSGQCPPVFVATKTRLI